VVGTIGKVDGQRHLVGNLLKNDVEIIVFEHNIEKKGLRVEARKPDYLID
jgi:hypothetical protein